MVPEDVKPVTVVVPTIGRPALVHDTLAALARCRPRAAEILVVDQSDGHEIEEVTTAFRDFGARHYRCPGRGLGRARNHGLHAGSNQVVMFIDDDCSVAEDWIGVGYTLSRSDPDCLWTGRVLALGDAEAVPSTKDDPEPHDFTGEITCAALYPNNMVLPRDPALAVGGFDETLVPAAEDCDFCYRWLRTGWPLRYEPTLVVHHREWRSHAELITLYKSYAHGQGLFYGKHLRLRDYRIVRFIARDFYGWVRAIGAAVLYGRPRWSDSRRGIIHGMPSGILKGWKRAASR